MQLRLGFVPSQLTLGSVQFGSAYGIGNRTGQPSEAEVFATLDAALEAGIATIDTARSYGSSESRIGRWLAARRPVSVRVITKVPALPRGNAEECRRALTNHLDASMRALGVEPLPLVLTHDESDLLDPHVVEAFQRAMEHRKIGGFGASTYRSDIAARLVESVPIAALQVPASVVDRRFEQAGIFATAAARGIAVFARSVFLQGALIAEPEALPAHLAPLAGFVSHLHRIARDARCSVPELLIPPIRDIPGATSLVIGVDHADQLPPHVAAARAPSQAIAVMQEVMDAADGLPEEMIDPSNWRSLAGKAQTQARP